MPIDGILTWLILLPLIGMAFILVFTRSDTDPENARVWALLTTLATFVLSLGLWVKWGATKSGALGFKFVENVPWFEGLNINYYLGVDGISVFMVLLTTFLMPICILASWGAIQHRVREFMMAFLLLESLVIGVFCALDLVLFYLFFEAVLIPMYFIIGIWGGNNRVYAAYKFFLYTLAGSVLMLVSLLYLYSVFGHMSIPLMMQNAPTLGLDIQKWLWLAMFASFAVKVPMWPFHTWLPDAHVQAPTSGSVILAGILLKMGAYGFLRFSLPMLPDASAYYAPFIFTLSIVAIIYTSLVALMQHDMKKLIAYSSVAHMGFVTVGIFALNQQGIEGAIIQMISHGLVSGALFLCVGVVYDRMHTREIAHYGGLVTRMPLYAAFFLFFTMASVGLPGTSGFVGEFLIMAGAYQASTWVAFFTATGVILGATYALWLYRRVVFGELTRTELKKILDLSHREIAMFVPIIGMVLWLGIYPKPFLDVLHPAVERLAAQINGNSGAIEAIIELPPVDEMKTKPEAVVKEGEKTFKAQDSVHESGVVIQTPEGVSIDVMETGSMGEAPTQENREMAPQEAMPNQEESQE
ncbi:MAG: NADH-quinone oxidoreductase subunit M [Alphaproteobacteria bacterium]|nr:NADH-quinone oxidoreductase subunit M [Alphaproteobacteria bacterium]